MKTTLIARNERFAAYLPNLVNAQQAGGRHDV